ncbi:MAG: nitroreductase family protein [Candidatus Brockarchaeota archaeon]|nr:nitroreductase family protein [Candidatus Brockarchaeota archaeon]
MEVFEAIAKRRSVRKYKSDPIPEEALLRVLEAARLAPSAGNRQPWRFVVVKDAGRRAEIAKAANDQRFVAEAPVVIAVIGESKESRWYKQDPMIAAEHVCLEAAELGLGTCWVGAFSEPEVKRILKIPEESSVICLIPLGYPAESPNARGRKAIGEVFFAEEYGRPYPA